MTGVQTCALPISQIKLSDKDAKGHEKNRYAFNVEYVLRNFGMKDASDFNVVYLLDGKSFYRQTKLSLKSGESRLVQIPVYFPIHNGKLSVQLDPDGKYSPASGCVRSIDTSVYFQGLKAT